MRRNVFTRRSAWMPRAKLTDEQVQEMRDLYAAGGVSHKELAGRFGVSKTAVGKITRRETYNRAAQ